MERRAQALEARKMRHTQPSRQSTAYNRHDINSLYLVNFGRVIDSSMVDIAGTGETGASVGGTIGTLNAINSGTTSTESAVLRILTGAIIGATIENSLTQGQAFEYIIKRQDGQFLSLVSEYSLPVGTCVMMRTHATTQKTTLEVKGQELCDNGFQVPRRAEIEVSEDYISLEGPADDPSRSR